MSSVIFFLLFFVASSAFALMRGGGPERWTAVFLVIALIASIVVGETTMDGQFNSVPALLAMIDTSLAVALTFIAIRANRIWIIPTAACQWLATIVHVAKLAHPAIIGTSYAFLIVIWSWPMTAMLAAGTIAFGKRRRTLRVIADWRASFRQPA